MSQTANLLRYQRGQRATANKRSRASDPDAHDEPNGLVNGTSLPNKLSAVPTHNAKRQKTVHSTKRNANVGHAQPEVEKAVVEISSDEAGDSAGDDNSDEPDDVDGESQADNSRRGKTNVVASGGDAVSGQQEEPSFGDLLHAHDQNTIVVNAQDSTGSKDLSVVNKKRILSVPTATSLGTVLAQALRTNDVELIESCLQVRNLESIRATIERLHSSLAATLLQKLAERMHKRPGRAGSLMVWVQWTVVAHGGYLAGQRDAMRELQTLYQVVKQRATGLQPLLALKGKLDMLEAQLQLRRNMKARSKAKRAGENNNEGVIYVEGQESDSEEDQIDDSISTSILRNSRSQLMRAQSDVNDDSEEDVEITAPNGIAEDKSVADSEDDSDEDGDGLIDAEAEETENESDELSEELDFEDDDNEDEDEDEEDDEDEDELTSSVRHSKS